MDNLFDILKIIIMCAFLIMLYRTFARRPKIKTVRAVKVPTARQIRRAKKRARRIRKVKRRFRIPYIGKTEIIRYDKTLPYIESLWDEIEHR